jgi:DNA primase
MAAFCVFAPAVTLASRTLKTEKEDAMPNGFIPFAEVKRAVPLEAILERYGLLETLTRKGMNLAGACPFCNGKSGRQFQVNLVKNAWYCFGCKAGGNILDFVAKKDGVTIRTAALRLDSWFELGLVEEKGKPAAEAHAAPAQTPILFAEAPSAGKDTLPSENSPLAFTLKTLDSKHESLEVLGLGAETLERFGAGYCARGLLKGWLAIPVHNHRGELLAYAGLALADGPTPRYLFPPKFHAGLEVFNLHRLTEIAAASGPLYLAPQVLGVLRLSEAGAVSVLGLFDGSLSSEQEKAIVGSLSLYEGFVLVGEGFADRTIARLARYAAVSWVPDLSRQSAASPSALCA